MRLLLLFLALPLYSALATDKDCSDLKTYAEKYEKDIQNLRLADCKSNDHAEFRSLDWDYTCHNFSSIELQLKSVENEIALLKGIEALRSEIKVAKTTLETKPDSSPDLAVSSKNFYQGLKIASTVELLLAAKNSSDESILALAAKAGPDEIMDAQAFNKFLLKNCPNFKTKDSICDVKDFSLEQPVYEEIKQMIELGKDSRKFDKKQISDIGSALEIKKGPEPYSYTKLLKEMHDPGTGVLSDADVEKLRDIPLENDKRFTVAFIARLKQNAANLKAHPELLKATNTFSRFSDFYKDLKNRQEWEMRSKVSILFKQYPDLAKGGCEEARTLTADLAPCYETLSKLEGLKGFQTEGISQILDELKSGQAYITKYSDLTQRCTPDKDKQLPKECDENLSENLAVLQEKALKLNKLKNKITETSGSLFKFRNFAVEKLLSSQCMKSDETNVSTCYSEIGDISAEAVGLSGAASDIMYVLKKPVKETDISEDCKSEAKASFKAELCNWKLSEPKKEKPETAVKLDESLPTLGLSRYTKTDWLGIGTSLSMMAKNYFAPAPAPAINPYALNPFPIVTQPPVLDPTQRMMYPALVQGLGVYFPTVGATPYSSIPSNAKMTSPYNPVTTKYFVPSVGW